MFCLPVKTSWPDAQGRAPIGERVPVRDRDGMLISF